MEPVLSWTLLALAAALVVLVVGVLAAGGTQGVRQFLTDLRGGLRGDHRDGPGVLDDLRAVAEDEDDSCVDDLFSLGGSQAPAYLGTERYLSSERLGHVVGRVHRAVPRQRATASVPRPAGGAAARPAPRDVPAEPAPDEHVTDEQVGSDARS